MALLLCTIKPCGVGTVPRFAQSFAVKRWTKTQIPKVRTIEKTPKRDVTLAYGNIEIAAFAKDAIPVTSSLPPEKPLTWTEIKLDLKKLPQQYMMLSKIRLTSLVVMTSCAGYALAPAAYDHKTFLACSLGTALVSCAANAVNQYHEVPFDAQMNRTKNRILVRQLLSPLHTLTFAAACGVGGLSALYFGVNGLTASLGALNLFLYTSVYTPLKRVSILNTWVGSIVGAIPPLMGWAGCTGGLESGAWILAGILYAWQFPHFNALSWNLRPDYSKAGYRMMSVTHPKLCRVTSVRYCAAITLLSTAAPYLDVTNHYFALESLPLNAYFLYLAYKFYQESDSASSRKLFRFSLIHLPALMILMLVNKKYWSHSIEPPVISGDVDSSNISAEQLVRPKKDSEDEDLPSKLKQLKGLVFTVQAETK